MRTKTKAAKERIERRAAAGQELFPTASPKAQKNAIPLMRRLGMVVRDGDVAGEEA